MVFYKCHFFVCKCDFLKTLVQILHILSAKFSAILKGRATYRYLYGSVFFLSQFPDFFNEFFAARGYDDSYCDFEMEAW